MVDNNEMFDLLTKMYSEVQGMKSEFREMKSDINGRLDNLENTVGTLENTVSTLEITVNKTNIIIENDIRPKIESLFDGYKQNTESINVLTGKVDDLQIDVNNLTIRTLKNENNMNHFSKMMQNKDYKRNL